MTPDHSVSAAVDDTAISTDTSAHRLAGEVVVVDLGTTKPSGGQGAVWSLPHGGDLDANLVRLGPGGRIDEHVNDDVDVLVFVQSGSGDLAIDGQIHTLRSEVLALIPRGARRQITAGPTGMFHLSIHRRRGPLMITRPPTSSAMP